MENKVFGEIKTTEELNELAVNLRKTKEFDEIRQLCKENNIPDDAAEDFIAGKRLHLADPGHQEKNDPNGDTGKMTGAGKRGENIRHFTSGHKDENTYGWPWNEVVKKYLESGYSSDQKECQVTIREKEYKILKRDAVTVFYDADGNTLFDVTNDRLKREYESERKRDIGCVKLQHPVIIPEDIRDALDSRWQSICRFHRTPDPCPLISHFKQKYTFSLLCCH